MSLSHLYNTTFSIERATLNDDSFGGQTAVFTVVAADRRGALQRMNASEIVFSDREVVHSNFKLFCDTSIDIQAGDHIKVGDRQFDVKSADNVIQRNLFQRVDMLEIV